MKEVAGTLKLDQASFRELEAFSKFGSDLDAATKAVLDKGARNVEILKQAQFSPLSVEKQVAIIFLGSNNLLKDVAIDKVRAFEADYLNQFETRYPEALAQLKSVKKLKAETALMDIMKNLAKEIAANYGA